MAVRVNLFIVNRTTAFSLTAIWLGAGAAGIILLKCHMAGLAGIYRHKE